MLYHEYVLRFPQYLNRQTVYIYIYIYIYIWHSRVSSLMDYQQSFKQIPICMLYHECKYINCGVPQGYISGLLFIIYINNWSAVSNLLCPYIISWWYKPVLYKSCSKPINWRTEQRIGQCLCMGWVKQNFVESRKEEWYALFTKMCLQTHQNIVIGGQSIVNGTKCLVVVTDNNFKLSSPLGSI